MTWDGVTTLDEAMFVEASADLAYSDAVALALEYSKSLPSPSPVGNATVTSPDGEQSAAISGCRLPDEPTFVCIVDGLEFGGDIVESGVRLRLELSNEGTPQYNPFADFKIDIEGEREPPEWLMNVGPDTGGSVLFVRLQWNFRGSL